jgi:uncharacterized membrane protein
VAKDWIIILLIALCAAIPRVYSLGHASLWFDEIWSWRVSNQSNLGGVFQMLKEDIHLPSYFVVTFFFLKLFGDGEFAMRLPAAIFGILSVPALYILGRRIFGRLVGLMAALMLIFSEFGFYYSQEARPYTMMLFLGIVTSYLWFQLYDRVFVQGTNSKKLEIGLWVMLAISCMTHYFSVLFTLFQLGIFAYFALKHRRGRKILAAYVAGLAILGALWVPMLMLQLKNLHSWTAAISIPDATWVFLRLSFGGSALGRFTIWFDGLLAVVGLFFLYRKGNSLLRSERKSEMALCCVLAILWLGPFIVVELVSIKIAPIFVDRYLLYSLPFAMLLVSYQITRIRVPKEALIGIILLISVLPAYFSETNEKWFSAPERNELGDWRSVAQKIKMATPPAGKTVVYVVSDRLGVAQYYLSKYAPNLKVAGEVENPEQVDRAYQNVVSENPDYIVFFYGQVLQKPVMQAYTKSIVYLLKNFGTPRIIVYDRVHPVGALLFTVHH